MCKVNCVCADNLVVQLNKKIFLKLSMGSTNYKKPHMYFLQAMMNRGILSKNESIRLCHRFFELENITFNEDMTAFLDVINQKIHSFHFEIKQAKREDTGETVFVLVSLAENDLNRLTIGGDFSKQELDIFKRILELVVYSDHGGQASSIDILNLADNTSPKISKIEIKKMLERFVDEQWFYEKRGMIILSPRTILELEIYISDVFKDFIHICKMCHMIVFYGKTCSSCSIKMHNLCADRYFSNADTDKCLACGNVWNSNSSNISGQKDNSAFGDNVSAHNSRKKRKLTNK